MDVHLRRNHEDVEERVETGPGWRDRLRRRPAAEPETVESKRTWRDRLRRPTGRSATVDRGGGEPVTEKVVEKKPRRVLVDRTRDRARRRRWRRARHNPVSLAIWAAGWTAAVVLVLGILLTWGDANPDNNLVDAVMDTGRWLATPFHDVFTDLDPDERIYANWGLAAAVYYVMGRILSWLTRI